MMRLNGDGGGGGLYASVVSREEEAESTGQRPSKPLLLVRNGLVQLPHKTESIGWFG